MAKFGNRCGESQYLQSEHNIAIAGTWENSDEKSSSPSICPRAQSINPSFFCNASSPGPAKTFSAPMLAEFDARAFAAIEKKKICKYLVSCIWLLTKLHQGLLAIRLWGSRLCQFHAYWRPLGQPSRSKRYRDDFLKLLSEATALFQAGGQHILRDQKL